MACEITVHKRVLFVLWGKPERDDFRKLMERAQALYAQQGPFVFIARVPAGAEPPDEFGRKEVQRVIPWFMDHTASYHAIMEGGGFISSAKRAVLASLFLMSPHRKRYHIHASIEEVLETLPPSLRADWMSMFRLIEPRGLLQRNLRSISPGPRFASAPPPP